MILDYPLNVQLILKFCSKKLSLHSKKWKRAEEKKIWVTGSKIKKNSDEVNQFINKKIIIAQYKGN